MKSRNELAAQAHTLRPLTSDEFRDVIGRFASGVAIITTALNGTPYGTTASAVASVTLEPPMLLICMNRESGTGRAITVVRRFAVNILSEDQADLAARFATKDRSKFSGVPTGHSEHGIPMLEGSLATLECLVAHQVQAGTHVVFLGGVESGCGRQGPPLAYFRGQFGRVELVHPTG